MVSSAIPALFLSFFAFGAIVFTLMRRDLIVRLLPLSRLLAPLVILFFVGIYRSGTVYIRVHDYTRCNRGYKIDIAASVESYAWGGRISRH